MPSLPGSVVVAEYGVIPEKNRGLGLRELAFQWERMRLTKLIYTCIYNYKLGTKQARESFFKEVMF